MPPSNTQSRIIVDPIYHSIKVDALESRIIDSMPFQRLRRIKQLGSVHLVFPGATHTRFSHCIGVMHVAGRIFDALFYPTLTADLSSSAEAPFSVIRQAMRTAGLVHDLGHGPLSHSFESRLKGLTPQYLDTSLDVSSWVDRDMLSEYQTSKLKHEHYTYGLGRRLSEDLQFDGQAVCSLLDPMLSPSSQFKEALGEAAEHLTPGADPLSLLACLRTLLSGELDADRLDYLARDAHHCGIKIATPDLDYLLSALSLVAVDAPYNSKLFRVQLKRSAVSAAERVLISRKQMFDQVYSHRINASFDLLLDHLFSESTYKSAFKPPSSYAEFLALDDAFIEQLVDTQTPYIQGQPFGDDSYTRGWMFLTRSPLKRVHEVVVPLQDASQKQLELRALFTDALVWPVPLKAFSKANRDCGPNSGSYLVVDPEYADRGLQPQPVEQASEVFRSTLWRVDLVKLVVFKNFQQSAHERRLLDKILQSVKANAPRSLPTGLEDEDRTG